MPAQRAWRGARSRGVHVLSVMAKPSLELAGIALAVCAAGAAPQGDPKAGDAIYSRCLACHALAYDRTGPRHCGLFGRRAGSVKDFQYSGAMRRAKIVWSEKPRPLPRQPAEDRAGHRDGLRRRNRPDRISEARQRLPGVQEVATRAHQSSAASFFDQARKARTVRTGYLASAGLQRLAVRRPRRKRRS